MNTENHREHTRFDSIHLTYICLDQSDEVVQQAMARTINISDSGILLETHFKMKKGYTLIASIGLRDETVDLKGKVIHVEDSGDGKYVAGIEITEIEKDEKGVWMNFLKKVQNTI